jgi:hypothetical protein
MSTGRIEVIAHPTVYNATRIASIPTVLDAIKQSTVSLRGWDFPHTDRENPAPFASGYQSSTVWDRYIEAYRLYQSGLFIWRRNFGEDIEGRKSGTGRRVLSFISASGRTVA